jgi:hypothetical protein
MALILVGTIDTETGSEVGSSRLRTSSPMAAVEHACQLNVDYPPSRYAAKIRYLGEFIDPALAELSQLAQQHGLEIELGGA